MSASTFYDATAAGSPATNTRAGEINASKAKRRPVLLLTAVVVLQALVSGWFASKSSWLADDFLIFQDAQAGGYTSDYLASESIAHFAPGHRFVTLVLHRHATFDFQAALGFLLVTHAIGVVLVQRIARIFAGDVWWTFLLAFAYGTSIVVLGSLQWFTAGLQVVPPATLTLASVHAFLVWRGTGRDAWLAWSVLAMVGVLAFYEKGVLVPVYLVLARVLLVDLHKPLRENVRAAAKEWRTWAAYAIPCLIWFAVYQSLEYTDPWRPAPLGDSLAFVRISWFDAFVPGALGVLVTAVPEGVLRTLLYVATQGLVVAAIVFTVRDRKAAWRPWAFLGIVFALNVLMLLVRVADWDPERIGFTLRYQTEAVMLTPLALAAAFGRRDRPGRTKRPFVIAGAVTSLAVVVATLLSSHQVVEAWPGRDAKAYFGNLRQDLRELEQAQPAPVLLDDKLPGWLVPGWLRPGAEQLSANLPLLAPGLRFDEVADPTYRVAADGHVNPVRFERRAGGDPLKLLANGELDVKGAKPATTPDGLCVSPGADLASVEFRPKDVLRGERWYLRTTYTSNGGLPLEVNRGVPYPDRFDRNLVANPGGLPALVELGVLPTGIPTFGALRILVPPDGRLCLRELEVGAFSR